MVRSLLLAFVCMPLLVMAVPQNNQYDTQPIYTPFGLDKFYRERDKGEISIHLSPFYQSTNTGRNIEGTKVPLGSMMGDWNMFALSFGEKGTRKMMGNSYFESNADKAFKDLNAIFGVAPATADKFEFGITNMLGQNGRGVLIDPKSPASHPEHFTNDKFPFAYLRVPTRYERVGIRAQLGFDFGFGLGVSVRSGVCSLKHKPKDITSADDKMVATIADQDTNGYEGGENKNKAKAVYAAILSPEARARVLKDFGLDSRPYQKTDAEDTHMQIYWHMPIEILDQQDELAMLLVPMIGCGAWIPTGKRKDQQKIFAVPTGNDGFYGITVDASFGLEFPVVPKSTGESFGIAFGGGAAFFASADVKSMRFATNDLQTVTILPWTADIVSKRPGFVWYLNASIKAEHFLETLSAYLDYVYTQHEKDDYVLKAYPARRQQAFEAGVAAMRGSSMWKNQQVQLGLKYDITPNIALGAAAQAHISGTRVARLVTLLGSMAITF